MGDYSAIADLQNYRDPNYMYINGTQVGPSYSLPASSAAQNPSSTASLGNIVNIGRSPLYMPMNTQARANAFGGTQSGLQGLPGGSSVGSVTRV